MPTKTTIIITIILNVLISSAQNPIVDYTISKDAIELGDSVLFSWSTKKTKELSLILTIPRERKAVIPLDLSGQMYLKPHKSISYLIKAVKSKNKTTYKRFKINVKRAEITDFSISADSVNYGEEFVLSWNVENAKDISIVGVQSELNNKGEIKLSALFEDDTVKIFTLIAKGELSTDTGRITLFINRKKDFFYTHYSFPDTKVVLWWEFDGAERIYLYNQEVSNYSYTVFYAPKDTPIDLIVKYPSHTDTFLYEVKIVNLDTLRKDTTNQTLSELNSMREGKSLLKWDINAEKALYLFLLEIQEQKNWTNSARDNFLRVSENSPYLINLHFSENSKNRYFINSENKYMTTCNCFTHVASANVGNYNGVLLINNKKSFSYLNFNFLTDLKQEEIILPANLKNTEKQIQTDIPLKAVLIVGSELEASTENKNIQEIRRISSFLQDLGIETHEFYPPCKYNNYESYFWEDIIDIKEPNIFIYAGHGGNGGSILVPFDTEGDWVEQKKSFFGGRYIDKETIIKDLKLHKNALVMMLHACFSAGSSASDTEDIGEKEAHKRVSDFAYPFIKSGATGYFATAWYKDGYSFLKMFFDNKTFKQSYKSLILFQKIIILQKYKHNKTYEICVANDNSTNNFMSYDFAYVAKTNFTYNDFFND